MDESLRRWCLDTLIAAQQHVQTFPGSNIAGETACEAERIVDLLAFQRLLEARNVPYTLAARLNSSVPADLNWLVRTCPLQRTDAPEVLGSIHEYLVARRTSFVSDHEPQAHRPRKSGGVFYTPGYVVDQIVDRTLGQRLANLSSSERDSIRILDPAAGCGAFLVGAYRFLVRLELEEAVDSGSKYSSSDVSKAKRTLKLPLHRARGILVNQIFGVDVDPGAVEVTRRILWMTMVDSSVCESESDPADCLETDLAANLRNGNSVVGDGFVLNPAEPIPSGMTTVKRFNWWMEFPQVRDSGGFDVVIGNPPYRREKDFKSELDAILTTELGRRYRTARMDLWYYFLHRGIELLKSGGVLSFITTSYWLQGRGSESVISSLREDVRLDELFLLRDQPVFPGITSQHVIFRVTKTDSPGRTVIRVVPQELAASAEPFLSGQASILEYSKTKEQLFRERRLDVMPPADDLLQKLNRHPRLEVIGKVRQGIAENPASINRRTMERFANDAASAGWKCGEGVFSLLPVEVDRLSLAPDEVALLRPYHDLCDLDRYWAAIRPSRQLIYSTRDTCPQISVYPNLQSHLARFRAILEARRETRAGANCWWHLHWPRADEIWQAEKLLVVQMAPRPSFVPVPGSSYVPFSVNVIVPAPEVREDIRYLCGLLNSRPLWGWFVHHAKRRGIGLELNGHVLAKCPIRRINFADRADVELHDQLVDLVEQRVRLAALITEVAASESTVESIDQTIQTLETQLDALVSRIYGLNEDEVELIQQLTDGEF